MRRISLITVLGTVFAAAPAEPSARPSCALVGWIDSVRLGAGSALTPDQRRAWMSELVAGVDLSDVGRTVQSVMPPAEAARVRRLISGARAVSQGGSMGIDAADLDLLAEHLRGVSCDERRPARPGRADATSAARLLDSAGRIAGSPPGGLGSRPGATDALAYAGLVLPLAAILIAAFGWIGRKERRARRHVCVLPVRIIIGGERRRGRMLDLSQSGCRLQSKAELPDGAWVSISAGPFVLEGRVAWRSGEHVGLAFSRMLPRESTAELRRMARRRVSRRLRMARKTKEA